MWLKKFFRSFRYAVRGLAATVRTQRNMRVHLCFAGYVVWFGVLAKLEPLRWAAAAICCGLVIGLELVNTAVETLCDRVCRERDEAIGRAKDAAAGAVLAAALGAAAAGIAIFLPWLSSGGLLLWLKKPLFDLVLALTLAGAVLFVRGDGT